MALFTTSWLVAPQWTNRRASRWSFVLIGERLHQGDGRGTRSKRGDSESSSIETAALRDAVMVLAASCGMT